MPNDHVAVYIVTEWERPSIPPPSFEIQEAAFFHRHELPEDTSPATLRRLAEIFDGAPQDPLW
jgi:hypothetical protein